MVVGKTNTPQESDVRHQLITSGCRNTHSTDQNKSPKKEKVLTNKDASIQTRKFVVACYLEPSWCTDITSAQSYTVQKKLETIEDS